MPKVAWSNYNLRHCHIIDFKCNYEDYLDRTTWCAMHTRGEYLQSFNGDYGTNRIFFEFKEDAMLFKLTWNGDYCFR